MIEEELIDGIATLLKDAGFAGIAKSSSSRSVTLSAQREDRSVVVHVADPEPAPGPRAQANPQRLDAEQVYVRAGIPAGFPASAVGGEASTQTAGAEPQAPRGTGEPGAGSLLVAGGRGTAAPAARKPRAESRAG